MALYQKKWWKKLFGKKETREHIDALRDIEAIKEYLKYVHEDTKKLLELFTKLEILEQEREVASSKIIPINLGVQAKIIDDILDLYASYQNDADVNGIRVKLITKEFLKHAKKAKMKELLKEKKEDKRWRMLW